MRIRFRLLAILGISFVLLSFINPCVIASSEDEATRILYEAEETLSSTFEAVKEAETNGAEIEGLSELLKDATLLLAQAYNSFKIKDFEKVENFGNLVIEIGNKVKATALSLKEFKSDLPAKELSGTIIESSIAVIIIIFLTFFSWNLFKRLYYKRKMVMKPQVISFEN
jgi:hypothetical protein